jgi:hypothetical protein
MKDSIKDYLLKIGFKDTTSLDDFVIELINEGYESNDLLSDSDIIHINSIIKESNPTDRFKELIDSLTGEDIFFLLKELSERGYKM